jgi:hypothetical protein
MKRNLITIALSLLMVMCAIQGFASSHREAPLISNDPLADNTDLYAFRSPDDTNPITIIACYVPMQIPDGGPNYYSFGENIHTTFTSTTEQVPPATRLFTVLLSPAPTRTLLLFSISV